MSICSLPFLFFSCAVVIVYQLAPTKWLRQWILTAANAAFLYSLVPDQRSWEWFGVFLGGTYVALLAVRTWRRGSVVATGIVLSVLIYLYLKRYSVLASIIPFPLEWDIRLHAVELVGLSYMIFKFIHMLVDQWQGQLAPYNCWQYLSYQLSFFTITAGPIQRYNDFRKYWEEVDLKPSETRDSLLLWIRILLGMIKIGVLGALANSAYTGGLGSHEYGLTAFFTCLYAYPAYLYLNFSGYTDVMIGVAGLLGFRLPENFNQPFLARNVLDFWDRWHISLTHWIRDYVFMSSYKAAATHFPRAARYWSYILLFFALFVAGIWHGTTDGFVLFGILNGLGAAATRAYGDVLRATLGRSGLQAYMKSPLVRGLAVVVTLHYVCICQLFFAMDVDRALALLKGAWANIPRLPAILTGYAWQGLPLAGLIMAALFVAGIWKIDVVSSILRRVGSWFDHRTGWLYAIVSVLCTFVAFMFFVDWAFQQEPPPVLYMAF
jgi:D-alanyl-lipoteichoic acid acyltransferase DltB (MBOAT superfamily)